MCRGHSGPGPVTELMFYSVVCAGPIRTKGHHPHYRSALIELSPTECPNGHHLGPGTA